MPFHAHCWENEEFKKEKEKDKINGKCFDTVFSMSFGTRRKWEKKRRKIQKKEEEKWNCRRFIGGKKNGPRFTSFTTRTVFIPPTTTFSTPFSSISTTPNTPFLPSSKPLQWSNNLWVWFFECGSVKWNFYFVFSWKLLSSPFPSTEPAL